MKTAPLVAIACVLGLSACSTFKTQSVEPAEPSPTVLNIKPFDNAKQLALQKKWLNDIQHISFESAKVTPIPATTIIAMLRDKGLNIVSSIPLDTFSYNGFGVTDVSAETALTVVFGVMGLHYDLDHTNQLVTVQATKPNAFGISVFASPSTAADAPSGPSWTLREGQTVGKELQAWAKSANWKVVWSLAKDWSVPANSTFTGDFKTAASDVIKTLAANGVLIRAQFYDGNRTMVVNGPGVAEQ